MPSGASTGEREALELRDGDKKRYLGKGVLKAVANVNGELAKAVVGQAADQRAVDALMNEVDGTPTKSRMGANAILGVSMALARATAQAANEPVYATIGRLAGIPREQFVLPVPMMNILNGGAHADSNVDVQEFMVVPVGMPNFREALRAGAETFHALRSILKKLGLSTGVGDEGRIRAEPEVEPAGARRGPRGDRQGGLQGRPGPLHRARRRGQRTVGGRGRRQGAPDARTGKYVFKKSGDKTRTSAEMVEMYAGWLTHYPIVSIEDGLAEGDWNGWELLTSELGGRAQLVGDDIFVTNPSILKAGIERKIANSILIKLNQIGSVTETLDAIAMARAASYTTVISHRSGETEDSTIADLAVGTGAGQIKTGSASRSDRVAKYNQLLRIEEELGLGGPLRRARHDQQQLAQYVFFRGNPKGPEESPVRRGHVRRTLRLATRGRAAAGVVPAAARSSIPTTASSDRFSSTPAARARARHACTAGSFATAALIASISSRA